MFGSLNGSLGGLQQLNLWLDRWNTVFFVTQIYNSLKQFWIFGDHQWLRAHSSREYCCKEKCTCLLIASLWMNVFAKEFTTSNLLNELQSDFGEGTLLNRIKLRFLLSWDSKWRSIQWQERALIIISQYINYSKLFHFITKARCQTLVTIGVVFL